MILRAGLIAIVLGLAAAAHAQAPPPDGAELIAWCRERLAGYKCPRSVDVVDTVGRTAMGKVNKRELRRPFWASSPA